MCCRMMVKPLDPEVAVAILATGLFTPSIAAGVSVWERLIAEEGASVNASFGDDALNLSLSPAISTYDHHAGKRIAAGVYFEIAAKYAEKVGGTIVQLSNVVGCQADGTRQLLLAEYPLVPLEFKRICNGFKAVLLGEQDGEHYEEFGRP